MSRFRYKTFNLADVRLYIEGTSEKDAFFSEDLGEKNKSDWDAALDAGYRWIRSEGEFAILELEITDEISDKRHDL